MASRRKKDFKADGVPAPAEATDRRRQQVAKDTSALTFVCSTWSITSAISRLAQVVTTALQNALQVLAVRQSHRDAALRSKRMRRSDGVPIADRPADADQPPDSAAAVSDAVAALAAERDVDSAPHLAALQMVRRLLSTGVRIRCAGGAIIIQGMFLVSKLMLLGSLLSRRS